MDTLQGCYKVKPRDCRYAAGYYVLLRCLNLIAYMVSKNPLYCSLAIYMCSFTIILLAVCRPYKDGRRTSIDIVLFAITLVLFTTMNVLVEGPYVTPNVYRHFFKFLGPPIYVVFLLFPLYGVSLFCCQVFRLASKLLPCRWLNPLPRQAEFLGESSSDCVCDRNEYSPLLEKWSKDHFMFVCFFEWFLIYRLLA